MSRKLAPLGACVLASILLCLDEGRACRYSEEYNGASVLFHAKLSSSWDTDGGDFFTADVINIYKADSKDYGSEISFSSGGGGAGCVTEPIIGQEYLLGLVSDSEDLTPFECDSLQVWSSVDKIELASCVDDPCEGACDEFEECLFFSGDSHFNSDEYFCADTCEPSPCEEGECCVLVPTVCAYGIPCSDVATCNKCDEGSIFGGGLRRIASTDDATTTSGFGLLNVP